MNWNSNQLIVSENQLNWFAIAIHQFDCNLFGTSFDIHVVLVDVKLEVDALFVLSTILSFVVWWLSEKRSHTSVQNVGCSPTIQDILMKKKSMFFILLAGCFVLPLFFDWLWLSSSVTNFTAIVWSSIESVLGEYGFEAHEIAFLFLLPPQPCRDPITGFVNCLSSHAQKCKNNHQQNWEYDNSNDKKSFEIWLWPCKSINYNQLQFSGLQFIDNSKFCNSFKLQNIAKLCKKRLPAVSWIVNDLE